MVALVAGASGIVGSGITLAFLKEGAKVWAPLRNEQRFEELKALIPKELHEGLRYTQTDLLQEADYQILKNEILQKDGKLNHVVVTIGAWREDAPLSELSVKDYKAILDYLTIPHLLVYKTFARLLSETPKSTFTFIEGGSGESDTFPAEAGMLPISNSLLYGMMIAAKSEFKENANVKFNQFRVFVWVRKEADAKFEATKEAFEVGHDYVGKFLPKMCLRHKNEIYRLKSREEGDALFKSLQD